MKTTYLTALLIAALPALPVLAQSTSDAPEVEPRPQEAEITEMADGGAAWQSEYTGTDGEDLYQTLCAGCHMPDGSGAVGAGEYPALSGNPNLEFAGYATYLIVNGQQAMPSFGHFLSDAQVVAITDFIQSGLGNGYEPDGDIEGVAAVRPLDPVDQDTEEHE
ncbi:c-type cytochrome [Pararhodobacter oceanensis]|nr:cytochrome c [Pararhodobacter oceanensis]